MKQNFRIKNRASYPFQRKGMWRAAYIGAGILAAVSLVMAARGNQAVCMALSSAGIFSMGLINVLLGYKSCGKGYFRRGSFWKDAGILFIWMLLLFIWYSEMTGRISY